ncbi:MAG: Flagellar hook-associated protein 1 [Phycisphaerae bacterium]|nr:Flagellar hook-associated protein 1 [Phycisphaerae bacterium]
MGLINGSLQIGRSAIRANQAAIQVIGNNIANASDPSYVRQKAVLTPVSGGEVAPGLAPGVGVELSTVLRLTDEAVNSRLRAATGDQAAAESAANILKQVEALVNALGDTNLSTRMTDFFNAFSDLANDPGSSASRSLLIQTGGALARAFNDQYNGLVDARLQVNDKIRQDVNEANGLIDRIAALNGEITRVEFGLVNASAGALRDQRDAAVARLAELADVRTSNGESGQINVYLGSAPLVTGTRSSGLSVEIDTDGEFPDLLVRADSTGQLASIASGEIGGLTSVRSGGLDRAIDNLQQLAASLINEVNRLHASGQGLTGYSSTSGANGVDDADAALNEAGLSLTPTNGAFQISLTDTRTGTVTSHLIQVDLDGIGTDTSLNSLVADLDGVDHLSASINPDGTLKLTADSGYTMTFSGDSSSVLAALGVNTFFSGSLGAGFAVRSDLTGDKVAAAANGQPGDNTTALALAGLGSTRLTSLGGSSLNDLYVQFVTQLASDSATAQSEAEASVTLTDALRSQRDAVSGVSLDEEAIDMMRYQQAFQGVSHYIGLVNQLISEIMNLI